MCSNGPLAGLNDSPYDLSTYVIKDLKHSTTLLILLEMLKMLLVTSFRGLNLATANI